MVQYNLSHLTQEDNQKVGGPIQDDEALFLYSLIKGMRIKTVFEIGGLFGYSAKNFLEAVGEDGFVFTCDINPVPMIDKNHIFLHKNALDITKDDFDGKIIELMFFDCHDYDVQMKVFENFSEHNIINDDTVLVFHDTNTHPQKFFDFAYETEEGWIHQTAERRMVNTLYDRGWNPFCLHTKHSKHSPKFPYRHGITVMTKFEKFIN